MRISVAAAVNGFIAITVMAFAGNVSAATYDIQDGNILAIGNLELDFDNDELDGLYNITFVTDTGENQYGDANFDFSLAENGVTAMAQIIEALNAAPDPVTGASAEGSDLFVMPLVEIPIFDMWGAVGSEHFDDSETWARCQTDCIILGATAVGIFSENTFARVTPVPEPGTALLMGLGLAGLSTIRRSKQQ